MSRAGSGYGDGPGIDSEELVKELLQKSGWGVKELRKAADEGRAPLLEMEVDDSVRVPDFQVHHPKHSPRYVEVKSFNDSITYGVENSERHGYEQRKHEDYIEFKKLASHPVYVFIHERKPGVVLRQRIRRLSPVQVLDDEEKLKKYYGRDHAMVFFERSQFDTVTDRVGDFSSGFGQDGLIGGDIDLSPFGLDDDDRGSSQATLSGGDF